MLIAFMFSFYTLVGFYKIFNPVKINFGDEPMFRINRPLLSLVLLTSSAPLLAQSTITMYGRVDLGIGYQTGGTTPINGSNGRTGAAGKGTEMKQGSAGRLGFRGSEDLGGGLKSNFLMEMRFDARNGAQLDPLSLFQARSFVELASSNLGSVYGGREYIPAFWPALSLDPWGFDSVGSPGPKHQFANYTVPVSGIRSNSTVGYKSPNVSGFTTNVAYSFGSSENRSNSVGANLIYQSGPVYLAGAFDNVDSNRKMALLGAAYNFGVARVGLTLTDSTVARNTKNKNISLTAKIPLNTHAVKLGYSRLDLGTAVNTRMSIGYEHALSKRTSILANLGTAKQDKLTRLTLIDLTVKHNF